MPFEDFETGAVGFLLYRPREQDTWVLQSQTPNRAMYTAKLSTFCREAVSALLFPSENIIANSLLVILFGLGIFLVATYLFTLCRFYLTSGPKSRFEGKEPPTLPYWIPFVGSAIPMVTDPHKFFLETL